MAQENGDHDKSKRYPVNLVHTRTYAHGLERYGRRLHEESPRLFGPEDKAEVIFWGLGGGGDRFEPKTIRRMEELKDWLGTAYDNPLDANPRGDEGPMCRFMFLHAPHSRAPLFISRDMFLLLSTYHRITPRFVDFVFPFGKPPAELDSFSGGFYHETRSFNSARELAEGNLDGSGHSIHLCYSLRSPEFEKDARPESWSVRQSAMYHSLDLETGRAVWMNVKGNLLMHNRLQREMECSRYPELSQYDTPDQALGATLSTHAFFADWSGESWRGYVNHLGKEVQRLTRLHIISGPEGTQSRQSRDELSLQTLWDVNDLVEKMLKSQLFLKLNMQTLEALNHFYQKMPTRKVEAAKFPRLHENLEIFDEEIRLVLGDMKVQLSGLNTHLEILQGRRELFSTKLRGLAAERAPKTTLERVSMGITTLVTLFVSLIAFISVRTTSPWSVT